MRIALQAAAAAAALAVAAGCQLFVDLDALENRECGPDEKFCPLPLGCVPRSDPATGCSGSSCAPCAPPHAMGTCGPNNECISNGCLGDWRDCDGIEENGCETDVAHDPENCERCFHVCDTPTNGTAGCSEKQCAIGSCKDGFEDCNRMTGDGCETDLSSNDEHCRMCNASCSEGTHCQRGVCI
jgi:hypothetical protein